MQTRQIRVIGGLWFCIGAVSTTDHTDLTSSHGYYTFTSDSLVSNPAWRGVA